MISPYHPNARFSVGTAMGRNKLIYAMADYGLVVSAEVNKGGTWTGAKEELRRENPIPVFTRQGENVPKGNIKLLELGALEWPLDINKENLIQLISETVKTKTQPKEPKAVNISIFDVMDQLPKEDEADSKEEPQKVSTVEIKEKSENPKPESIDAVYKVVLPIILKHLEETLSVDELVQRLEVVKTQLNKWLKKRLKMEKSKNFLNRSGTEKSD